MSGVGLLHIVGRSQELLSEALALKDLHDSVVAALTHLHSLQINGLQPRNQRPIQVGHEIDEFVLFEVIIAEIQGDQVGHVEGVDCYEGISL